VKILCVLLLFVLSAVPVLAAPDCPPTPTATPPATAVTVVNVSGGSWWVWPAVVAVVGAVCFGWGWLARHEAQCEREFAEQIRAAANRELGRKEWEAMERQFEEESG
jgi:hypothetical protein